MATWVMNTVATLAYVAISFILVQSYVPNIYMDEEFHVPQTLRYLEGRWTEWDPKLTTPPGLYLLGVIVGKLLQTEEPSLVVLRGVNLFGLVCGGWIAARGLGSPHQHHSGRLYPALLAFPLLQFYANLYYTDVWSTVIVLAAIDIKRPSWESALFFLISLFFRQTNIVWVGYAVLANYVVPAWNTHGIFKGTKQLILSPGIWAPYALVVCAFAIFLITNGSIVLGDKSNHIAGIHTAQVLYFWLFFAFFSFPIALQHSWARRYLACILSLRTFLEMGIIALTIRYGTIVHPFILSDNRHVPFYLWRRLLHPAWSPWAQYIMVPVYHCAYRWWLSTLSLSDWPYIFATCAVLIPTPLLEPRYYILPYLVWRLRVYGRQYHSTESAYNMLIGGVVLTVFCVSDTHYMW